MSRINPNFFYDYQKMYAERSSTDHENYVDRLLHAEDQSLKQYTNDKYVQEDLENEIKKFLNYQRMKRIKDAAHKLKE